MMILNVRPLTHVPAIQMEFVYAALGILEIIVLNVKQVILIQMETILILVQLVQVNNFLNQNTYLSTLINMLVFEKEHKGFQNFNFPDLFEKFY